MKNIVMKFNTGSKSNLASRCLRQAMFVCLAIGFSVLSVSVCAAQPKTKATGTVVNEIGEPMIGVNVVEKDTTNGTTTGVDGSFAIDVAPGASLEVSFVGYVTKTVSVGKQTSFEIALEPNTNLDAVVVVGYGTIDKRSLTNSVSKISQDDFTTGTNSPLMAIQGKIPGLSIQSTNGADPNSGVSLQLRGVNSVNGDQGPLVVIDGVPGAEIDLVAKEDIESITVLKDASAAAIYGTRATGGVVLITTKRPQAGRLSVNFSTELQLESIAKTPDLLTAAEFREYGRTGFGNAYDFGGSTNWYNAVTRKAPFSQRYALSANGGSDKYRVSASGYIREADGLAIRNDREEIGGRLSSYFKFLNNRLELAATINYTNIKWTSVDNSIFEYASSLNPTYPIYDNTSASGYYMILNQPYFKNPVAEVKLRDNNNSSSLMLANISLKLNITDHWSVTAQTAYKHVKTKSENFVSKLHRESLENHYNGTASHSFAQSTDKLLDVTTNYDRRFKRHSINAVLGYSFQEFNGDSFSAGNTDFLVDGLGPWDLGAGTYLTDGKASMSSYKSPTTRLIAFFGRANYSFDDRYLLTVNLRYEGSSKFAKKHRWGLFPGISAGWRISSEKFMRNVHAVDDLKLRVSYGTTGNQGFNTNTAYRMYAKDSWVYYKGQWLTSYGLMHNQNSDMKWEVKKELDVGLDFSFFNHRLSGRLDYFNRKIENVIYSGIPVASPPAVYATSTVNIGDITNNGFEFELAGRIVDTKDWKFDTSLVGSFVGKSRFEGMDKDTRLELQAMPHGGGTAVRIFGGQEVGKYFLYRFAGVRQEDGVPMIYNKDNQIIPYASGTDADRVQTGNGLPKAMLSWNNTVRFRNWDLNLYFRSWLGQDVYNVTDMTQGVNCKITEGQNLLRSAYRRNKAITNIDQLMLLDYWLENGNFLKLDAITLGYTLPRNKVKYIEKLRCYFTVRNVCTLTGYTGMDPEVNVNGLAPGFEMMNQYPRTRTYVLGIEIGF